MGDAVIDACITCDLGLPCPAHPETPQPGRDEGLRERVHEALSEKFPGMDTEDRRDFLTDATDAVLPLLTAELERDSLADLHYDAVVTERDALARTAERQRESITYMEAQAVRVERQRDEARERADRLARAVEALASKWDSLRNTAPSAAAAELRACAHDVRAALSAAETGTGS